MGWFASKVIASTAPKAVASSTPPANQCVGCGKRSGRLSGFAGIRHCAKPSCTQKAARMIDNAYGGA